MPTIVEALVTTLTLDASEYIANAARQRAAMKAMSDDERQFVADLNQYNKEREQQKKDESRQIEKEERERQKLQSQHQKDLTDQAKLAEESSKKQTEAFTKVARSAVMMLAIFTAGRGIKDFVMGMTASDAATGRLSRNIGMNIETLSRWQNVATQFGGTAEGVSRVFETWSDDLNNFNMTGQSTILPMFNMIKVGITDATGHMRDFGDIAMDIARSPVFQAMSRPAQATFLKPLVSDPGMANAIMNGPAALAAQLRAQPVVTERDAKNAALFEANLNKIRLTSTALGRTIFNDLAPSIDELLNTFNELMKANGPEITHDIAEGLKGIASDLKNTPWKAIGNDLHTFIHILDLIAQGMGGWVRVTEVLFALWAANKVVGLVNGITQVGMALARFALPGVLGGLPGKPGGLPAAGRLGLLGGLGAAAIGWEAADVAQQATQPTKPGYANLAHNVLFDGNPLHWTQSYGTSSPAPVAGGSSGGSARGLGVYTIGDSIAAGAQKANGYEGGGVVGANPTAILRDQIGKLTKEQLANKTVLLSSGISNDTSQMAVVEQELQALQALGVRNIRLLGTGTRSDLSKLNPQLAELAHKYGAEFMGPLRNVGRDGVHPSDYHGLGQSGGISDSEVERYRPLFDLIGKSEGTDKRDGYNETLGYGKWTGGVGSHTDLTHMTLDQIDALQTQMLNKQHAQGIDNDHASSALGRYQFTQTTLREMRQKYGLGGNMMFDQLGQDRLAMQRIKMSGRDDPEALARIWASLPRYARDQGGQYGQGTHVTYEQVEAAMSRVHGGLDPSNDPRYGAGQKGGGNQTVQIDRIDIHTQATDAPGIARDLRSSLDKYTFVRQANTGVVN